MHSHGPVSSTHFWLNTRPNLRVLDQAVDRDDQITGVAAAPAARVSVLTEIDTLPNPSGKATVADWDGEIGAKKRGFYVRTHVIGPLVHMSEGSCFMNCFVQTKRRRRSSNGSQHG